MRNSKKSFIFRKLGCIAVAAAIIITSVYPAFADSADYTIQSNRYVQNINMDRQIQSLDPRLYLDASLGEMSETKETPMTEEEQRRIRELGIKILTESGKDPANMTDYEKTQVFHDWIKDHFYYYHGDDVKQNPAELYRMYEADEQGRVLTWCNGYSAMLIAFCRSQGIPATTVAGHYIRCSKSATVSQADESWKAEALTRPLTMRTHWWAIVYVNKNGTNQWVQVDCNADCYNSFSSGDYTTSSSTLIEKYSQVLFAPDLYTLSRSHIIWGYRLGSHSMACFFDEKEKQQISSFLEYSYMNMTNGERINGTSYNKADTAAWFAQNSKTEGFGNGKIYRLYFPESRGISGELVLNGFEKLRNIKIVNNNINKLDVTDSPSVVTVNASGCRLGTARVTGSSKINLLNLLDNPLKKIEYDFKNGKTAVINAQGNGTVSVRSYLNDYSEPRHRLVGKADTGYLFEGWYSKNGLVNTKSDIISTKAESFEYTAVFKHKMEYLNNESEISQLLAFLGYEKNGISNGTKINGTAYDSTDATKWFPASCETRSEKSGRLYKLYVPDYSGAAGALTLNGFEKLRNVKVSRNPLDSLDLTDCKALVTVAAVNCSLKSAKVLGSSKITLINLEGNPLKSAEYTYKGGKTAKLYAGDGGTIEVKSYLNSKNQPRHMLVANADEGYKFKGWYSGSRRINKKAKIISVKNTDFEYKAVFEKTETKDEDKK